MTDDVRIGLLGVGRIGLAHAEALRRLPGVAHVVLADADSERARAAAARLGAAALPVDEVFGAVDGLVIATPTPSHADLLERAVAAGLPAFCEKPVALDVATTRRVVAAVQAGAVPVQIGFQRRFDAGYRACREAVARGDLGELRRAHLVTCDPSPPPAEFIAGSGGLFADCGIHDVDALRWVSGHEVVEVSASGANRGAAFFGEAGDVDEAVGWLRLDDDTLATLQLSRYNGAGYDVRLEVAGTLGTRVAGLDAHSALVSAEPGVAFPAGVPHAGFSPRFEAAYAAELAAFVEVVAHRLPSPAPVGDALEALYVCVALERSRRQGRPVRVDEVRSAPDPSIDVGSVAGASGRQDATP